MHDLIYINDHTIKSKFMIKNKQRQRIKKLI